MNDLRLAFFGTPELAVVVLDELEAAGIMPTVIITAPDAPQGRGLVMTPPPVKAWAQMRDIEVLQPEKLDEVFCAALQKQKIDLGVVVAYGKILPAPVLALPPHGILNVHPSLLPHWRGPSPVVSAILADDKHLGVSIIQIDEKMDHGPILGAIELSPREWPPHAEELEHRMMSAGGNLLASVIPFWMQGRITPHMQDNSRATYCKKITKEDGLLDLTLDPYQNLLKIRAYEGWPGTYTFFTLNDTKIRVKVIDAHIDGDVLIIDKVTPEGKREMSYAEFIRSGVTIMNTK